MELKQSSKPLEKQELLCYHEDKGGEYREKTYLAAVIGFVVFFAVFRSFAHTKTSGV